MFEKGLNFLIDVFLYPQQIPRNEHQEYYKARIQSEATTSSPLLPFIPTLASTQFSSKPLGAHHHEHSMVSLPNIISTSYGHGQVLNHNDDIVEPMDVYVSPETSYSTDHSSSVGYFVNSKNGVEGCQGCCPMTNCPSCQAQPMVQNSYSIPFETGSSDPYSSLFGSSSSGSCLTQNYYSSPNGSTCTRPTASPYLVVDIPGIFRSTLN